MKRIFVAFLFLLSVTNFSFGQEGVLPLDSKNNAVYSDVGSVQLTKDVLFQNAQKWVVKTFGNYENAVASEDRASGKLVLNTYAPISSAAYEYLRLTMTIVCQDNKYQVSVTDLEGIAKSQSITRLGKRQNDAIQEKSVLVKTESNRKKKAVEENELEEMKSDNNRVNDTVYGLLASLKQTIADSEN